MAARGRRPTRSVRFVTLVAVVALIAPLVVGTAPFSRTAAATEVVVTCGTTAVPLTVVAEVDPAEVPAGGLVRLTVGLTLAETTAMPAGSRLGVSLPVPTAVTAVPQVAFSRLDGFSGPTWSVADGRLAVAMATAEVAPGAARSVTFVATTTIGTTVGPGAVSFTTPDLVTVVPPASPPVTCGATSPPAVLATVTVVAPPPTTRPPGSTTTTTVRPHHPPAPPERPPVDDPAAGGDAPSPPPLPADEVPWVPPPADPASASRVLTDGIDAARARLRRASSALTAAQRDVRRLVGQVYRIEGTAAGLDALRQGLASVLAVTTDEIGHESLDAYLDAVRAELTGAVDPDAAARTGAVLQASGAVHSQRLGQQAEVTERLGTVSARLTRRQDALDRAQATRDRVADRVVDARRQVATFRAGGTVVSGFHFVVRGEHSFTDTWLAPRSGGRRHQGTDIFAAEGTPLVAAERGVLADVGTDTLGGTSLWLVGESGTHYYYAHLSGYADGVADGVLVEGGEVVGYVGHTGNARTTPPHLHFEIHPRGGDAVNGYPLLAAADGLSVADPVEPEPEPVPSTTTTTSTTTTVPPGTVPPTTVGSNPEGTEGAVEGVAVWRGGTGSDRFDQPAAGAVGPSGRVFVADTGNDRIVVLAADGRFVRSWGGVRAPTGVATATDGTVVVADAGADRIRTFTPRGEPLAAWGRSGAGTGALDGPAAVAVDARDRIYVADTFNDRIQVFTLRGRFLRSWGGFGTAVGELSNPYGVAISPEGRVVVADTFNGRLQVFTPRGEWLATWPTGSDSESPTEGLELPYGVAVDRHGVVTVIDRSGARLVQLGPAGRLLGAWGGVGHGPGRFADPTGVAVDPSGRVLVADTGNDRVQRLTLPAD